MQKVKLSLLTVVTVCALAGCGAEQSTNIEQGMQLLEQMDYNGAIDSFEAATVYNEDEQLIYRGEGLAYMGLGDYEKAAECFLTSISYSAGKVTNLEFDTNYYLASSYYKSGKYEDAQDIYSAIIGLHEKDTDAYYLRACTFLKEGNYDAAVQDFEKAFSLDSDNLELVTSAYEEMQAAGFADEGKAYIQSFMDKSDKKLTDSQKGILYYYMEDYANARIYLDGALNGTDAKVSLMLGQTYEKLGDMNYAAVVYQTYLDANAPDAAIYNSLGNCLMKQQKYEDAFAAYEAGIESGDSACLQSLKFNQIVANEYMGNFSQAKSLITDYLNVYTDDAKAQREAQFLQTR